jgi:hypothetical protein
MLSASVAVRDAGPLFGVVDHADEHAEDAVVVFVDALATLAST